METVTISSKYQVLIPRSIREALRIQPGQEMQMICCRHHTELIPIKPVREARGLLGGIDTTLDREPDRG